MSRPVPYTVADRRTAWIDYASGVGVDPDGRAVFVKRTGERTRHVSLVELLDFAAGTRTQRLYLTGRRPEPRWLEKPLPPQWSSDPSGHYYDSDDPCGRFVHEHGGRTQIRRAAPWFGDAAPGVCADAWELLGRELRSVARDDRARLFDSPTATGQQLWALSLPRDWDGARLDDDTAALVRATSPQHRMEVTAGCYAGCDEHWRPEGKTVREAHYLDGRWMYANLLRELRAGAAERLTQAQAFDLFDTDPYARARYQVTVTVPAGWAHVGLLMAKHPDGQHWHAPSKPGVTFTTWCDAAEARLALSCGWDLHLREGLLFTGTARALDTWRDRILRLRERFDRDWSHAPASIPVAAAALNAVRAMLVTTIGGFHSTGRERTIRVPSPADVPAGVSTYQTRPDGTTVYKVKAELHGNAAAYGHPELSAQVWGRAHTRLIYHRTNRQAPWTGALALPGETVLGMWGDALYLTCDPQWPDDGTVGRLRTKGHTTGRIRRPTTLTQLNQLRLRIEKGKP